MANDTFWMCVWYICPLYISFVLAFLVLTKKKTSNSEEEVWWNFETYWTFEWIKLDNSSQSHRKILIRSQNLVFQIDHY